MNKMCLNSVTTLLLTTLVNAVGAIYQLFVRMGQTNIRSGGAILERAGRPGEDSACIPDFQKYVLITGHDFTIGDIQKYWNLLRFGNCDVWNKKGVGFNDYQPVEADQASQIPMVHVSKAVKPELGYGARSDSDELVYIIVVEGRNRNIRSKLVDRVDLARMGTDIFWECVNGYSIVFSGAVLKADWNARGEWPRDVKFKHVKSKKALVEPAEAGQRVVKIWC